MAKKKQEKQEKPYCRAIVDYEGNLRWEYQHAGMAPGRSAHDEDVSEWTDEQIIKLTRESLGMDDGESVEVIHD